MEQYAAIGKAVALRPEKGAAVLPPVTFGKPTRAFRLFSQEPAPDAGLLPDLWNHPDLLKLAMQTGWTSMC